MDKNRRLLLKAPLLAGMVSTQVMASTPGSHRLTTQQRLAKTLLGLYRHTYSMAAIGDEYLREFRQENSLEKLVDCLCDASEDKLRQLLSMEQDGLHAYFDRKILQDFEMNKTVKLDGWILSVTESRICALSALI